MTDEWTPCHFIEYPEDIGGPRYGLLFDSFGSTQATLESKGFMGGGYTWHGIVESLIRQHHPEYIDSLEYDPESSMFCVRSSNLDALKAVRHWIYAAATDPDVLQKALDHVDESIIE